MALSKRTKKFIDDIVKDKVMTFKKTNDSGYETITPLSETWNIPIQVGFTKEHARIVIPDIKLIPQGGNVYTGTLKIKKGFKRIFFEKRGDGYSSVAHDYYIPTVEVPISITFLDFGKQLMIERKNGYKTYYVDERIDARPYILPATWDMLSEDDRMYFADVNTASLRADLVDWLSTPIRRTWTAYYQALININEAIDLFKSVTEPIYITVPTEQYTDANIVLSVGEDVYKIDKYSVFCEGEFAFTVSFDFRDEILEKVKQDGYVEE